MLISGFIVCDVTNIFVFQPLTVTSLPGSVFHPKDFRNKKFNWIKLCVKTVCWEVPDFLLALAFFNRLFFLRSSLVGFDRTT